MENTGSSTISSSPGSSTAVIRLHSMGDVILAQPAAAGLTGAGPVHFVTSNEYRPIVERMAGNIMPAVPGEEGFPGLRRLLARIGPSSVVDLQNSLTTRLATLGMNVTGRFRMDRKSRSRILRGSREPMPLRTDDFLAAAGFGGSGEPELERRSGEPDRLTVGIVAGGRWPLKSIPRGVVTEAARLFHDLHGADVLITGGPGDSREVSAAASEVLRPGVDTYAGEEGVRGLIKAVEGLSLLVSPDSGPAHLAAAMGVPVLVVFTSTSPALGFWRQDRKGNFMAGRLACRPCHRHGGRECARGDQACRRGILPLDLVGEAMELLE